MKVILVMVMSLDGKTTKWYSSSIYQWTSQEDQQHFFTVIQANNAIIMGSKTFLAAKSVMKLSQNQLRVVMTSTPQKYKQYEQSGVLEFTDDSPGQVIDGLKKKGYIQVLLVGGSTLNTAFLKQKLVDELWITIEPKVFASGTPLFAEGKLDILLELQAIQKLNKQGTLILKYDVMR